MKNKKFIIIILILLFGLPSVSMAGSFVVSLIQGKTPAEAVQIIAEQIDSLLGRVQTLETQQTETSLEIERLKLENENLKLQSSNLEKESALVASKQQGQACQAMFIDVPKIYYVGYGEYYDIKANIVRYYELNKFIIDNKIDNQRGLADRSKYVQAALPLYQKFKNQCPSFETNELPVKTGWCISAEKESKCNQVVVNAEEYTERSTTIDRKFEEFNCSNILQSEVPNRTPYTCG